MRGGLFTFLFPRDCLLVIIICFSGGYCLCHLTSCLIPNASRLNSDTELMCDDMPEVFLTGIKQADAVIYSAPLIPVYNLRMTYPLSLGKLAYYE